jgi:hypothetical protein
VPVFAIAALIAALCGVEDWKYFLYGSPLSLYVSTKLARGIDPYEKVPEFLK